MNDKTIVTVTKKKTNLTGGSLTVTAKLNGRKPYFSVTGEERETSIGPVIRCGCIHEDILREFPEFERLIALHLSDAITGEPMHAVSNGFYWLAGVMGGLGERYHGGSGQDGRSPEECLGILASHLRVNLDEARRVAYACENKTGFATYVDSCRERWEAEAKAGLALIGELSK